MALSFGESIKKTQMKSSVATAPTNLSTFSTDDVQPVVMEQEVVSFVRTLTLDSHTQIWQYKPTEVGSHVLTITCRDTVKTINVTISKLDINVEPITTGLQFDFNPIGRSNNDANKLWIDETNSDVKMTVSENFDWSNGGYQLDENGDQYFGIKAGTKAVISYNLFADDARRNGKEFKFVFKTTNVAKADATFLSCESNGIGLQMNVHEASVYDESIGTGGNLMSDFIESLKRLYRNKMLKNEQLDHLLSIGKISKEEFEYIKRKEG